MAGSVAAIIVQAKFAKNLQHERKSFVGNQLHVSMTALLMSQTPNVYEYACLEYFRFSMTRLIVHSTGLKSLTNGRQQGLGQ